MKGRIEAGAADELKMTDDGKEIEIKIRKTDIQLCALEEALRAGITHMDTLHSKLVLWVAFETE
jgi:hypothetical protein